MTKAVDKINPYEIVPMTDDDRPIVTEFLKKFFFQHEPLTVFLKIFEDPESFEKLQNFGCRTLDNGLTLKAMSPNGDLVGVITNDIMSRDNEEQDIHNDINDEDKGNSIKFKKFMALFQKIGNESDVFGKFPDVNRIMEIKIVAVNEVFRGQGVCKALFEKTIEMALENECSMVYVECSSHFSANVAEKLGFQCIYSLNYQEYKNEKDEVIFNPSPPHEQFKVYVLSVKKISTSKSKLQPL